MYSISGIVLFCSVNVFGITPPWMNPWMKRTATWDQPEFELETKIIARFLYSLFFSRKNIKHFGPKTFDSIKLILFRNIKTP